MKASPAFAAFQPALTPEQTRQLQVALTHLGYYHGAIDGLFDTETTRAADRFARDHGLGPSTPPGAAKIHQILAAASNARPDVLSLPNAAIVQADRPMAAQEAPERLAGGAGDVEANQSVVVGLPDIIDTAHFRYDVAPATTR